MSDKLIGSLDTLLLPSEANDILHFSGSLPAGSIRACAWMCVWGRGTSTCSLSPNSSIFVCLFYIDSRAPVPFCHGYKMFLLIDLPWLDFPAFLRKWKSSSKQICTYSTAIYSYSYCTSNVVWRESPVMTGIWQVFNIYWVNPTAKSKLFRENRTD